MFIFISRIYIRFYNLINSTLGYFSENVNHLILITKMNHAYSFLFCYVASLDSRALFNDSSILRRSCAPVIVATNRDI
jgi:hypothetical protein